jgi:sarcosine oxidase subunit gamma
MSALPAAARWVFHADADARAAATPVWGTPFATDACRAFVGGERATLWLGPDEYLLLGPASDAVSGIAADLERALKGVAHALVDVSHRQFALEVKGPHAATILSGGCPLDLHIDQFPVGMCTRTVFAKADVVLWRTAPDVFHVEVWRSFAGYVIGLLQEIGREFTSPG